ncbi:catalase [Paenibacillus sp. NPDC058071]|uniref:catalase n=1 Tax=Paenibacillus sp. NPDC058071 TaxID=3346326 RepID=UPI0036DD86BB
MDDRLTTNQEPPVEERQSSPTAEQHGSTLSGGGKRLLEEPIRFDRERVPVRAVHVRGAGAHGIFRLQNSMKPYTKAAFLQTPGQETPVFVRFSSANHGTGLPEAARDPRGFAVKFYTEEGNLDIVGHHLPVYFIRDALKFPELANALKPDLATSLQDPNRFWRFMTSAPESTHMMTWLYSDDGTPATYREMDGFGVHAFKWINAEDEETYVKYHWKSLQGVRHFTTEEAGAMQTEDFSHATRDLYAAIELKNFPSWELHVQIMPVEHLSRHAFDPLDPTKVWPDDLYPLHKVGTMTLNRNPVNYFGEVERSAFAPNALVPGIAPSEDQLLQGRLLSYPDAQRSRLGTNYLKIPVNCPHASVGDHQRTVAAIRDDSSLAVGCERCGEAGSTKAAAETTRESYEPRGGYPGREVHGNPDDFTQAGERYISLSQERRDILVKNLIHDLLQTDNDMQLRAVCSFYRANAEFGVKLAEGLGVDISKFLPQR